MIAFFTWLALSDAATALHECQRAQALALELQSDSALEKFADAQALLAQTGFIDVDRGLAAECAIGEGAAWLARGKSERAAAAFRRALILSPLTTPDADRYNPEVFARFHRAQRMLAQQKRGSLTVVVDPVGAHVWVDGARAGLAPLSVSALVPGEHWLVVTGDGYEAFVTPVIVPEGNTTRSDVFLKPLRAAAQAPRRAAATVPAEIAPSVTLASVPSAPRVNAWLAITPLGIGQFAEHRYAAGGGFLAGEVALLAANLVTGAVVNADAFADHTYGNKSRDRALQVVNLSAAGALVALVIGEAVDGWLHR